MVLSSIISAAKTEMFVPQRRERASSFEMQESICCQDGHLDKMVWAGILLSLKDEQLLGNEHALCVIIYY